MARRTKEEAEQTRQQLLDTALQLFSEQGITATSLKSVAAKAEVTHGALYWHFRNRSDLVATAYHERRLPLDDLFLDHLQAARQDALSALRAYLVEWIELMVVNDRFRRFWLVFHRQGVQCPELEALADELADTRTLWLERLSKLIKKARKQKQLKAKPKKGADLTAQNLLLLVCNLINTRLLQPELCKGQAQVEQIIDTYLAGLSR